MNSASNISAYDVTKANDLLGKVCIEKEEMHMEQNEVGAALRDEALHKQVERFWEQAKSCLGNLDSEMSVDDVA